MPMRAALTSLASRWLGVRCLGGHLRCERHRAEGNIGLTYEHICSKMGDSVLSQRREYVAQEKTHNANTETKAPSQARVWDDRGKI